MIAPRISQVTIHFKDARDKPRVLPLLRSQNQIGASLVILAKPDAFLRIFQLERPPTDPVEAIYWIAHMLRTVQKESYIKVCNASINLTCTQTDGPQKVKDVAILFRIDSPRPQFEVRCRPLRETEK